MTDITALARKADHPFDDVAVEAHAISLCEREFPQKDWDTTVGPALKAEFMSQSRNALTAAFKSMKDRGLARDIPNFVLLDGLKPDTATVTIIRHKENGDG